VVVAQKVHVLAILTAVAEALVVAVSLVDVQAVAVHAVAKAKDVVVDANNVAAIMRKNSLNLPTVLGWKF
jgi:hypothetical protein